MLNFILTHSPLLYLTQSLWRDEAFSILLARNFHWSSIMKLGFEPPFYYFLLSIWVKIFGSSEIAARSLSFTAFVLATIIVIIWAEKIFRKNFMSWFLPLSFFLNPMLLYYAFEVRAYAWVVFFTVASLYTYTEKKWRWFIIASTLGFYCHTYFIFVILAFIFHYLMMNKFKIKNFFSDIFVRSTIIITLLISPWIIKTILNLSSLKKSWYYPVDFHLVKSVIGNMYLGYEGTPGNLWTWTAVISLILLVLFYFASKANISKSLYRMVLMLTFLPLVLVVGVSFIKPIYVNRYLIPVTVGEVFLIAFALSAIKNKYLKIALASVIILFNVGFNFWFPAKHAKLNIRDTMIQINALKTGKDLIYVNDPLILFETIYYSSKPKDVYLFNPSNSPFPWYIGDALFNPKIQVTELPTYPERAFLIKNDASFAIIYQTPLRKK